MIWVLGGHENESALSNTKSYNMYFEQQINQKDTKTLSTSWFCNAFYDYHIFSLSHWCSCWLYYLLEDAEDAHKQTVWINQKAVILALTCIDVLILLFLYNGFVLMLQYVLCYSTERFSGDHIELILFL